MNSEFVFPYKITDLDEKSATKIADRIREDLFVRVGPKQYLLPAKMKETGQELYNFQPRSDDIWLLGFLRSGTTVTQEILYLLGTNLDYEAASKTILDHRFPIIEYAIVQKGKIITEMTKNVTKESVKKTIQKYQEINVENLKQAKGRRFIKSHLPISVLPFKLFSSGAKVVYCTRNPKDLLVSNYHAHKLFSPKIFQNIQFEEFWELFKSNLVASTPYLEHVKEAWAKRNDENFKFIYYEDIRKDLKGTILGLAEFLGKTLTEDQLNKLEDHVQIDNFRKNKSVNNDHLVDSGAASGHKEHQFIRQGKVGGWRSYFSEELNQDFEQWLEEGLKDSDLVFKQ